MHLQRIPYSASHGSKNSQSNFTDVSINSHSAEPTVDTENGCASWGGQRCAPGWLIAEALTMPVDEGDQANRWLISILDLQKTVDDLASFDGA